MLRIALLCITILLSACTPQLGRITKTNSPETWTLSREGDDSLTVRDIVFEQADIFCREKKTYLMPVSKKYTKTFYQLFFRCLSSGDPDLIIPADFNQEMRYRKKLGGYGEVKY